MKNERLFWVIGFAIIIFLVLLLGSLIGMKITRDRISGLTINDSGVVRNLNDVIHYDTLENGTKRNNSEEIANFDVDVDFMRFSNFVIEQDKKGKTTVSFKVENLMEEEVSTKIYTVKLYDDDGQTISEFSVTPNLENHASTYIIQQLSEKESINANRIEVVHDV